MKINETLSQKVHTLAMAFLVNILWLAGVLFFLSKCYTVGFAVSQVHAMPFGADQFFRTVETPLGQFFFAVIFAPIWEEAVFRYAPLKIIGSVNQSLTWPIVVITSIVFGLLHGGVNNILIQGFGGFVLAYVFIKNGWDYKWSVAYHALWNLSVVYLLPYLVS